MAVRNRAHPAWLTAGAVVVLLAASAIAIEAIGGSSAPNQPTVCLYTRTGISGLEAAAKQLGVAQRCAVVFNRAAPTWTTWERPWFIDNPLKNYNWNRWGSTPGRRLIITQGLIPDSALKENWRMLGAAGAYASHATTLARNLVAAGLGGAIIRLSNEPNGSWFTDNLGTTPADARMWVEFWQRTARAMLAVPGGHFQFDWTVSNGIGATPLAAYYPGDGLVTYVGDDIYDSGLEPGAGTRWSRVVQEPGGVNDVIAFAQAHHKQFSIPEWGLAPPPTGGGDDVAFVNGIARLTRLPNFGYQSYFFAGSWLAALKSSPHSLAAYRRYFDGRL